MLYLSVRDGAGLGVGTGSQDGGNGGDGGLGEHFDLWVGRSDPDLKCLKAGVKRCWGCVVL